MRYVKAFLVLAIVLGALGVGVTFGLRASRDRVGAPSELKPNFVTVTNAIGANAIGVSLYAARAAPGAHVVVFDAGLDPQGHPIDALLAALGARRDDVTDVFLTHGHPDHVAGIPVLAKARVHLGAADIPLAAGLIQAEALVPVLFGKMLANPPVKADAPLSGATTFPVGAADATMVVKAYPVPGHTPGSYVFLYDGVLVAGDIMVLKQGRLDTSPRMVDPHPEQNKAAIVSLKTKLKDENVDIVCTSHGGCTPKGLGKMLLDDLIQRLGG
jgi:glyoxylase-like metal-dependent hydrolase (beta-lactamase superfamily II)